MSLGGRTVHSARAIVALLAALACLPACARADVFGTTALVSASPFGQAEYAHDPALSEDGRFIVFDGSVGGVQGVWRHESRAGAPFEQVAGGDATLPSVSADGRYVSFTTNQGASLPTLTDGQIHPPAVEEAPGVYVRDMATRASEPGAFTLVSAKDQSTQSLIYEFPGASPEEEEVKRPRLGATAGGRSAITADGRTVAFVTTAQSDLAGPGTPPMQVAVRHLDTHETELVSVRYDPATGEAAVNPENGQTEPVPEIEEHGAVWSFAGPPTFSAAGITRAYRAPHLAGASISADGTTVAWLGQQIAEQVRTLSGEQPVLSVTYAEPLWRRISAGPLEPTRRVAGGAEPENPACQAQPEGALPDPPSSADPCQGPFATQLTSGFGTWNNIEQETVTTPRLSANGNYVAFIATAPLTALAGGFGLGGSEFNPDAYWMDMTAPTRRAGLHPLTQFASGDKRKVSTNAGIDDIAISSDGRQIAFTTKRTVFPLGTPAYVSVPAAVPGLDELYDVDLGNETLTRVTSGYEGGAPQHSVAESTNEDPYPFAADGALSPSFSSAGAILAFSSTAANLVFGDGNTPPLTSLPEFDDGADAFVVPRITFEPEPTPETISAPPANPLLESPYRLIVTAVSLANGTVQLRVRVPATGVLSASASSALPAGVARRAHRKVRRTVARASATARPGSPSVIALALKLNGRYSPLASRSGGLPGTVTVTFAAGDHPTLHKTLAVRFLRRHARGTRGGHR